MKIQLKIHKLKKHKAHEDIKTDMNTQNNALLQ
jgi:hypothetical protein